MSKQSDQRSGVEPWLPPSGEASPCVSSPAGLASASPPSPTGSNGPKASGWIASTGPIVRTPRTRPRRTDIALEDLVLKTRRTWPSATWEPSAPPPSATLSGSRASRRRPRFGPSTASSLAVARWTAAAAPPAAAAPRLVSARGRRGPGAVGQLRHRRGTGHPRRPPGRGAQRGVLARRIGCLLADGVAGHGGHDRAIARGALARSRLARLRPVRQRHDLPGHASLRGCPGTDHPLVPELRSGAGVRPAA